MKKCKGCGKILKDVTATHCSDECLFKGIEKSKSLEQGTALDTQISKSSDD